MAAKDDELAGRDEQLCTALREAAVINEQYISDLSAGQQQLESEVASLTAQLDTATAAAAERAQQEADMQTVHKRLRGQVSWPAVLADHTYFNARLRLHGTTKVGHRIITAGLDCF